jgi:hypothetical protein
MDLTWAILCMTTTTRMTGPSSKPSEKIGPPRNPRTWQCANFDRVPIAWSNWKWPRTPRKPLPNRSNLICSSNKISSKISLQYSSIPSSWWARKSLPLLWTLKRYWKVSSPHNLIRLILRISRRLHSIKIAWLVKPLRDKWTLGFSSTRS